MYANIIIDISHEKLDRTFQYRIPERLLAEITAGVQVLIPFGNSKVPRKGYVIEVREKAEFDPEKTKEIIDVVRGSVSLASQQIRLAWWMKERYGSTMNQALKTVLPVKQQVRQKEKKVLKCLLSREELELAVAEAARKHYKARERLLRAFTEMEEIPYEMVTGQMNLTAASMKPLVENQKSEFEDHIDPAMLYNTACSVNGDYVASLSAQVDGDIDQIKKRLEETDIADDQRMEIFILILALAMKADAAKYTAARLLETYFINPEKERKEKVKKPKKSEEK